MANTVGGRIRRVRSSFGGFVQTVAESILHNVLWKILIILFTIVLLLGRPCQFWFFPQSGDKAMNVLHFLGFCIFCADLILHCFVESDYLPCSSCSRCCCSCCCCRTRSQGRCFPFFEKGPFDFWCDFFSTICFLLEIESFNPTRFSQIVSVIPLNAYGMPDPGVFAGATAISSFVPYTSSFILILKTTRVARLVPPLKVVDASTKINLQWYFERLNPTFYWKLIRQRRPLNRGATIHRDSTMAASSGGGLLQATVATLRARKEKEKKLRERGMLIYVGYELRKWARSTLRCLRILPHKSVELNRQIAATRIQRAWRNRNTTFWEVRSGKSEGSQAWRSPRDGMSLDDLNPSSRLDHSNRRSPKARVMVDQNGGGQSGPLVQGRGEGEAPSRVGAVMAELTGHRVVVFLLLNLLIVLTFTYIEPDNTDASTMIILHHQTTRGNPLSAMKAVEISRRTVLPNLFLYTVNSSSLDVNLTFPYEDLQGLREYEIRNITITDAHGQSTGLFSARDTVGYWAMMELYLLVFVLLLWFFGVAAFAAPIMSLVIVPIERAVKLMSMLVADPLGYRSTLQYKNFLTEADQTATNNGRWTRDVLKGMETEFLMSTIDRIGSLMKVGFGSAGVRIIRNSLQKNDDKDTGAMLLNSKGSIVSCIFLFCDIRSFTDATECLQEEVFAFTNRVAAVVHSICSSYGGSANKNIGDAFLISWKLDGGSAPATRHQADKALLSVVKICIALHHNDFYLAMLSDKAKERLLDKMKNRPGPTVQIGFGLHAGKAVEGAIGSQRKIDATYVSMAVETAEYLESSTKKYKVPILMSGSFHRLLQPSRRTRCRLLDRVVFEDGNAEVREGGTSNRDKPMKLFTYDMDVDALWNDTESDDDSDDSDTDSADLIAISSPLEARRNESRIWSRRKGDAVVSSSVRSRASGIADSIRSRGTEITAAIAAAAAKAMRTGPEPSRENNIKKHGKNSTPELVLPTGPALYSENVWLQSDIRRIRRRYTTNIFDTFNLALQKYYAKEWDEARKHFEAILENFDDGPSKFYLGEIRKHDGIPPPDFRSFEKF